VTGKCRTGFLALVAPVDCFLAAVPGWAWAEALPVRLEAGAALSAADADKLALELGEGAEHGHSASTVSSVFTWNSILSGISVIA
jgi:hypothetical protein